VTLEEYLEHLDADTQTWLELFEYTG
jgi:hypothetical protein